MPSGLREGFILTPTNVEYHKEDWQKKALGFMLSSTWTELGQFWDG
jgi:hypothetical protein